jgi:predicted metalloprotease with PDZ domain
VRPQRPALSRHGGPAEGYRTFLGLCSHEYFHAWHVKRIKPAAFAPYDLDRENHTRLLWIFEGFTSYYDDLMLVRSGVIGVDDYLKAAVARRSRT